MEEHRATFELIGEGEAVSKSLSTREIQENLLRWGLNESLKIKRFRYGGKFASSDATSFLSSLLSSCRDLNVRPDSQLDWQKLKCTVLNMEFFDRLHEGTIATEAGTVRMCMDEDIEGKVVSDLLREMLANPTSENTELFSKEEEQQEFIFQLFKMLCLGGAMMQPDESTEAYLETTKVLYKDVVSVYRSAKTRAIEIGSVVYQIFGSKEDPGNECGDLFPNSASPYNFCFVIINPSLKQSILIYQPFVSFW
mmetsp:Transcript_4704/g.6462  ORF Transcript_4704/g.6462 Transcript_4704/m.6462 type:complete len:252 (-) Transcript_4704:62-817(-)